MPKDDPLGQGPRSNPTTLWLDRDHMEESRDAYFQSWWQSVKRAEDGQLEMVEERVTWNTAYAAAVAAFEFLMSGKMRPGG